MWLQRPDIYFQDYPVRDDISLGLLFVVKLPLLNFIQRMLKLNKFSPFFVYFLLFLDCLSLFFACV